MADSYWAEIKIGGQLKKDLVEALTKILDELCLLGDENNPEDFVGKVMSYEDCEASNGRFKELEEFCEANNLSYVRNTSDYDEYEACISWWTPENGNYTILDKECYQVLRTDTIKEAIEATKTIQSIESAPIYINDTSILGVYAKYVMENNKLDAMDFLEKRIAELSPTPPELPVFEIIP